MSKQELNAFTRLPERKMARVTKVHPQNPFGRFLN